MRAVTTLILVCSLGGLSFSQTGETTLPECGTTFTCFAPVNCLDGNTQQLSSTTTIEEVKSTRKVAKNCEVFIRFHAYTKYWMYVSIESFNTENIEPSIEFKHISNDNEITSFECKLDPSNNDIVKGGYFEAGVLQDDQISAEKNPLKCTFLLKKTDEINQYDGKIQFILGAKSSAKTPFRISILHCDPSVFKFKPSEKAKLNEKYEAVPFDAAKPGNYECGGKLFYRMEYLPDDSDAYVKATDLKCFGSKFSIVVDGQSDRIEFDAGSISIRCVADAEYFCNYFVKTLTSSGDTSIAMLEQRLPDKTVPSKGEIKCPATHPFIMMNGKRVADGDFKCENRGVSLWTLNEQLLRENSVEVYCANELNCHIEDKLPAGSIKKGTLVNRIPTCRDTGTMKVLSSSEIVSKVFCNKKSGKYMYTTGDQDKEVGNSIFTCEYPSKVDNKKNEENKSKALHGGLISTACSVVGAIVLFALGIFAASYLRFYFLEKKMMKLDDAAFNEYCTGEVNMNRRKKNLETERNSKSSAQAEDVFTITDRLYLSMRQLAADNAFYDGSIKYYEYVNHGLNKSIPINEDIIWTFLEANKDVPLKEIVPTVDATDIYTESVQKYIDGASGTMAPSESELSAKEPDDDKKNN